MRRLVIAIIASLVASSPLFAQVIDLPPLPPEVARHHFGDHLELDLHSARQATRPAPPMFLDYPGKRDTYTSLSEGAFDVTRVDTEVTINLAEDGPIGVNSSVTLVALEPGVSKFEFYVELPEVVSVVSDPPLELTTKKTGDILVLTFQDPLPVEEPVTLHFNTWGEMNCDVQFMLPTCRLTGPWKYVTHSQFLPYLGGYSEMFVGDMVVTVTGDNYAEWHAGGTGTYVGTTVDAEAQRKSIHFEHIYPTSLYAWSATKSATVHAMAGDIPISATVQLPQLDNMPVILGIVQDVLAYYSEIFVSYPWNNLDVVSMPKSFSGGFGPLSTIFVMRNILDATPDNNSIYSAMTLLSHEIGHEWWGNLVEMADSTSVVISEGLAEFSSNRFMELVLNGSRYFYIENSMSYAFTVPHDEEPILISPFVYSSPYYYQVAYQKGAAIIDMLRLEIGEDAVLAGLKGLSETFFMEYAYPEDLFDQFEVASGQDLDYFYDQWMAGRGPIRAVVGARCEAESDQCTLTVKQDPATSESLFQFNLPLRILKLDDSYDEIMVRVDQWETTLDIPLPASQIRRIYVDPRRQLTRILRPALPGDLDLNGVVDGADLLELSFAYQVNLVVSSDWGEYFYANGRFNDLADMATDSGEGSLDGRVNQVDLDLLLANIGLQEAAQDRLPEEE